MPFYVTGSRDRQLNQPLASVHRYKLNSARRRRAPGRFLPAAASLHASRALCRTDHHIDAAVQTSLQSLLMCELQARVTNLATRQCGPPRIGQQQLKAQHSTPGSRSCPKPVPSESLDLSHLIIVFLCMFSRESMCEACVCGNMNKIALRLAEGLGAGGPLQPTYALAGAAKGGEGRARHGPGS